MAMYPCLSLPSLSFPTLTGSVVTFNSQYALPLKSHTVDIDYTGSAISEVNVFRYDNNNLYDKDAISLAYLDANGVPQASGASRCTDFIEVVPNSGVTFRYTYDTLYADGDRWVCFYDSNKAFISGVLCHTSARNTWGFIVPNNAHYMRFTIDRNCVDTTYIYDDYGKKITFPTPIYGGSYDCLTGIVTSDKDSGGGDITPTYQQTATANCETNLGVNNIWADTGDTTLQYPKFG